MWVDADFAPHLFWDENPGTFALAMEGVRKRMKREDDAGFARSYEIAILSATAQAGKLKTLAHYQRKRDAGTRRQSPQEMLAVLKSLKANGAKMKISRVKRGA